MDFERQLILSASRKSWHMSSTHGTEYDKDYKKNKKTWDSVWARDKHKCYYCGFTSLKYQAVHPLNDDHNNNAMDNLVTVCPLCHQNFHLDTISNTQGGKIIWLPEFSQQELNYICRAIFIASEEADIAMNENKVPVSFAKMARVLESSLSERSAVVDKHFKGNQGVFPSDPSVFANVIINMKEEQYNKRGELFKSFKLLHFKPRYHIATRYWKNVVFKDVPVDSWVNLLAKKV